jgi:hypothetical protein
MTTSRKIPQEVRMMHEKRDYQPPYTAFTFIGIPKEVTLDTRMLPGVGEVRGLGITVEKVLLGSWDEPEVWVDIPESTRLGLSFSDRYYMTAARRPNGMQLYIGGKVEDFNRRAEAADKDPEAGQDRSRNPYGRRR